MITRLVPGSHNLPLLRSLLLSRSSAIPLRFLSTKRFPAMYRYRIPMPGVNVDPSGTVNVVFSGSSSSCVLNGARCTVSLTPKNSETITASYAGDSDHSSSTGNTAISVLLRQSSLDINCNPGNVQVNQPTTCTINVNGQGPGPSSPPTGSVTISVDFTSSGCTLAAAGGSSSSLFRYVNSRAWNCHHAARDHCELCRGFHLRIEQPYN